MVAPGKAKVARSFRVGVTETNNPVLAAQVGPGIL
jgi:hypothetical protein